MGRSRDADGTASSPTRNDDLGARCLRRGRSYAYVRAPCVDAKCRARVDRDTHLGASHRYPNRSTYVDARPDIHSHVGALRHLNARHAAKANGNSVTPETPNSYANDFSARYANANRDARSRHPHHAHAVSRSGRDHLAGRWNDRQRWWQPPLRGHEQWWTTATRTSSLRPHQRARRICRDVGERQRHDQQKPITRSPCHVPVAQADG